MTVIATSGSCSRGTLPSSGVRLAFAVVGDINIPLLSMISMQFPEAGGTEGCIFTAEGVFCRLVQDRLCYVLGLHGKNHILF